MALLAGCAGVPVEAPAPASTPDDAAYEALERGEFHAAARRFLELGAQTSGEAREQYRLQAVDALLQGGLKSQAALLLESTSPVGMPPQLAMQRQLLAAELALPGDPDRALALLLHPAASERETALHARYHHLRARAFAQLGNHLEAAREYIERELFLTGTDTIEANQLATWEALSHLSNEALSQLRIHPPPNVLSGWMELALLAKDVEQTAEQVSATIAQWRERYPSHPALPSFLRALEHQRRDLLSRPDHIAVLLPFSGHFAAAAEAVRDGIVAAYYRDPQAATLQLHFYDEGDASAVIEQYARAIDDGAQFVIGPLGKEAVQTLARLPELSVPTLALNDVEPPRNEQLFQFGLAPEDEARQAAELAWLDGFDTAAVLYPQGPWGERLHTAFMERWEALGGRTASSAAYDPQQSDFSDPLRRLLNLDQSELRRITVQDVLRQRVDFDSRRRQDLDFVFLGAFPVQARLIRPQLRFHRAIGMPIYATSHIFAGTPDAAKDRDMDDVVFGDMPWTLDSETPNAALRREDREVLRAHGGSLQRLVAMGVDAYHLVPRLKLLAAYPHDRYQGETGTLRVDNGQRVRRHLLWARFVRGEPRLMDTDFLFVAPDGQANLE